MLEGLAAYISQAREYNEELLPRNQHNAAYIIAKTAMLDDAALGADIINGRRWHDTVATTTNGTYMPIAVVFPLESMRAEASLAAATLAGALQPLEDFFDSGTGTPGVKVWYGFVMGNTGGGGTINSEDRATYETRTPATRLPFDAILAHELGHSYVGQRIADPVPRDVCLQRRANRIHRSRGMDVHAQLGPESGLEQGLRRTPRHLSARRARQSWLARIAASGRCIHRTGHHCQSPSSPHSLQRCRPSTGRRWTASFAA